MSPFGTQSRCLCTFRELVEGTHCPVLKRLELKRGKFFKREIGFTRSDDCNQPEQGHLLFRHSDFVEKPDSMLIVEEIELLDQGCVTQMKETNNF